jgi:hypothetical protein
VQDRVEDLLSQPTLEDKIGLMFHDIIAMGPGGQLMTADNSFGRPGTETAIRDLRLNHFNLAGQVDDVRELVTWHNRVQELALATGPGIPVTLSTDPRHAFSNNPGTEAPAGAFSQWPQSLGLATLDDPGLVHQYADIVRQEYLAAGLPPLHRRCGARGGDAGRPRLAERVPRRQHPRLPARGRLRVLDHHARRHHLGARGLPPDPGASPADARPGRLVFDFSDSEWHFGRAGAARMANAYPETPLLLHHWGSVDAPDFPPFNGDPQTLYDLIKNPQRLHVLAPGQPYRLQRLPAAG